MRTIYPKNGLICTLDFSMRDLRLKNYKLEKELNFLIEKIENLEKLRKEVQGGAKIKQINKGREQALEKYNTLIEEQMKLEIEIKNRPDDRSTYQTVKGCIDRAIKAIEEKDEKVAKIFDKSINRSKTFYYHPSDNPTELFKTI